MKQGEKEQMSGGQTPQVLGILGDPVGHTLSPVIHRCFAARTGTPLLDYLPFQVRGDRLGEAVRGAHALGIRGLNVTVPHKSAVIPFLNGIDPLADRIGAVNTLVREEGGYKGYNTDATGLKRALERAGVRLAGAHVVVLGAGGAGRAVAFLGAAEGAAEVVIVNRSAEKAAALADEVKKKVGGNHVRAVRMAAFLDELEKSDAEGAASRKYIAIQCTSVGLYPNAQESVVTADVFFRHLSFAVDIVYRPLETKFLGLARKASVPVLGGLSMLLYQAADAFMLWYSESGLKEADLQSAMRAAKAELLGFTGIALVGFMGSGKTTVARALADTLHYDVWDTDRMIEEGCGKSVRAIFADEGEEAFRRLETATLQRIGDALASPWEGETDGVVLATGGGLPMREENRALLARQNARTIWLRVQPDTVAERLRDDGTRPLLAGTKEEKTARIAALLAERNPVYASCADLIVDTDGKTPGEIAAEILAGLAG